jgi:hypothetical protein
MSERGMKKYMPFSSLVEQEKFLNEMLYEKHKIDRPEISDEMSERINRILISFDPKEEYVFKFYIDGYVYTYKGKIKRVNLEKKTVLFQDFYSAFTDIVDIESTNPYDDIS